MARRPPATPSSTCTPSATARSSTWRAPPAIRTRCGCAATACARLQIEPVELGPFQARFSAGVRAADLVLATSATAVLAYNDEVAVGVVNRLADRGVRVPHDMSIVGFDDTSLAEMVTPRLTTVRLPMAAAGQAAARMLIEAINGRDGAAPSPLALPAELIVRSSTGPLPPRPHERMPGRP
jgi:LacI family transcriptional regulator/LacI family repressor for deo operon, udp, cdd, tsx, nupC, and nupG